MSYVNDVHFVIGSKMLRDIDGFSVNAIFGLENFLH